MEDTKPYSSATTIVIDPQFIRSRHHADVPEDVDFLITHLNDPNYDLRRSSTTSSDHSYELDQKGDKRGSMDYKGSEFDTDSQVDYTTTDRAGSRVSAIDFDDESPYPEVRAAVATVDDPNMPVSTIRMWFMGLMCCCFLPSLNTFLALRYPSVLITGIVAALIMLPVGRFLARILPTTVFNTFGFTWTLNPGPFNVKEHVVITVMANVSAWPAYATDIVATQIFFYGHKVPFSYQVLLTLAIEFIGFSLAGVLRRFLVWPSSMIWPGALVNCALFNTLHKKYSKKETKHISRERFFCFALLGSFLWYFVPGYLFTGLSMFNWLCWIAPKSIVVNQLFGTASGLGMSVLTFDWAMISYIGSPLVTPWWSEANAITSFAFFFWFIAPIIYYTNTWFSKYMPISSYMSFDNKGLPYDPIAIFTDGGFDVEKYRAYSPLYLTSTFALAYGIQFASFTAIVVHTILWYRRDIMKRFGSGLKDERDVHSRLMQVYSEVPHWWYAAIGVVSVTFGVTAIEIFPTKLPIWAFLLAYLFAAVFCLPVGMIQAITNQSIYLGVVAEMLAGYMLPNRPVANMIFKAVCQIGSYQAVLFSGDLKLGHYMKIPPRIMFTAQIVAVFISCLLALAVQNSMFKNIPDICTLGQKDGFICPSTNTFATASLVWGGIGPQRLFGPGSLYRPLLWFFLAGALSPIPFYFLAYRFPLSLWRYVNMPVFFASVGAMPPASGINYASWAIVGWIFQFFMRRYHFRWWMRYNYILSAGLDTGVAICFIFMFLTLSLPKGGVNLKWWGNEVWMNTADAAGTPFYTLQPDETFGLPAGSW